MSARLANANLGASGGRDYSDTAIAEAIEQGDDLINYELDITTNTALYAGILKNIATDIIAMFILQARHFKENNSLMDVATYWAQTPDLTNRHLRKLRTIRRKLRSSNASIYNASTGFKVM